MDLPNGHFSRFLMINVIVPVWGNLKMMEGVSVQQGIHLNRLGNEISLASCGLYCVPNVR
jgi:hypothetical protein